MIVVSNASPLTNLAAIGQFRLFSRLYGHLHIAEGVWSELNAGGKRWPGRDDVAAADWVERHAAHNLTLVTALERDLDHGEPRLSLWRWSLRPIWSCSMSARVGASRNGWGCA